VLTPVELESLRRIRNLLAVIVLKHLGRCLRGLELQKAVASDLASHFVPDDLDIEQWGDRGENLGKVVLVHPRFNIADPERSGVILLLLLVVLRLMGLLGLMRVA
jgi:hypothetical protein